MVTTVVQTSRRNYSIDLLRFVCIVMVVSGHYFLHGGFRTSPQTITINMCLANAISALSRVAVNCFFMITGFFSIKVGVTFTPSTFIVNPLKKALLLDLKMIVYGVILYTMLLIFGVLQFHSQELVVSLFPIMTNRYWFVIIYIALILIFPFVAKCLNSMDTKTVLYVIMLLFVIDSVFPMLDYTMAKEQEYHVFHAITMAGFGYVVNRCNSYFKRIKYATWPVLYILFIVLALVLTVVTKRIFTHSFSLAVYNSPLVILSSVFFFMSLQQLTFRCSVFSRISPYILAIYLINDNDAIRHWFYYDMLHCPNFYSSPLMILHFLFSIFFFVAVGLIADYILTKLLFKYISGLMDRVISVKSSILNNA